MKTASNGRASEITLVRVTLMSSINSFNARQRGFRLKGQHVASSESSWRYGAFEVGALVFYALGLQRQPRSHEEQRSLDKGRAVLRKKFKLFLSRFVKGRIKSGSFLDLEQRCACYLLCSTKHCKENVLIASLAL